MKKIAAGVLAAFTVVALTACAPHEGTIRAKQHEDGYYYPVVISTGKSTITVLEYRDPTWCFDLYDAKQNHGWRCVSQATYNKFTVGQYYQEKP